MGEWRNSRHIPSFAAASPDGLLRPSNASHMSQTAQTCETASWDRLMTVLRAIA